MSEQPFRRKGIWRQAPVSGHWKHVPEPELTAPQEPGVKLMPDYLVDIPLWGEWTHLNLSAALLDRLHQWQELFDRSFHWDTGWATLADKERWANNARLLETELRAEVGGRAVVTVDLWPIEDD